MLPGWTLRPCRHLRFMPLQGQAVGPMQSSLAADWHFGTRTQEDQVQHEHEWGPVELARFTGEPHRKCQVEGCRFISLDLDEEDE